MLVCTGNYVSTDTDTIHLLRPSYPTPSPALLAKESALYISSHSGCLLSSREIAKHLSNSSSNLVQHLLSGTYYELRMNGTWNLTRGHMSWGKWILKHLREVLKPGMGVGPCGAVCQELKHMVFCTSQCAGYRVRMSGLHPSFTCEDLCARAQVFALWFRFLAYKLQLKSGPWEWVQVPTELTIKQSFNRI